jgi:phage gp36-like protein
MKLLLAVTEDFAKTESGILNADAAAGSNVTLTLKSNNGFADGDYIAIGHEGNELCELAQINNAVTGSTQVRVATLKFNHAAGAPIRLYRFNQRKFYGATSASGSYTELTADGSPKDIMVDDPQGTWLEYTGSQYTYFKATYFNSTTDAETALEDAEPVLADETVRYASIYAIRKHAGLAGNPRYSDLRIETKRKQAENEINSAIAARYALPLSEVPPLISQICELLAAGYIDYEEFGKDGEGVRWLGEARALIKAIRNGTQLLIGSDGTELTRQGKVGVLDGYPNSEDVDPATFRMSNHY